MAITCGWASIDENGRARGGKAGDQTGREVKTGPWYDFGQTEVLRWKDRAKAKQFATIIRAWCNNPHIGYDQDQRTTLGSWCKSHGWDYKVTANVETDCSRMVADGVNCVMKRETIKIASTFYTGNLGTVLKRTGLFTSLTGSKYCDQDAYLMEGDIINNPARHVIVALANGSKAGSTTTTSKRGYTGTFPTIPKKGYIGYGDKGAQVSNLQRFLNWYGGYGLAVDGQFGPKTLAAVKKFQKAVGTGVDGQFGPKSLAKAKAVKK